MFSECSLTISGVLVVGRMEGGIVLPPSKCLSSRSANSLHSEVHFVKMAIKIQNYCIGLVIFIVCRQSLNARNRSPVYLLAVRFFVNIHFEITYKNLIDIFAAGNRIPVSLLINW